MDFTRHATDSGHYSNTPCWWNFEFPNGASANVELARTAFRFNIELDEGDGFLKVDHALTSDQVEEKLTKLAALPGEEEA